MNLILKLIYFFLLIAHSNILFSNIIISNKTEYNFFITYRKINSFDLELIKLDKNNKKEITSNNDEIFYSDFFFYKNDCLYSAKFTQPYFFLINNDNFDIKFENNRFVLFHTINQSSIFCIETKESNNIFLKNSSKYKLRVTFCENETGYLKDIRIKPGKLFKTKKIVLFGLGSETNLFPVYKKEKWDQVIIKPGIYVIKYDEYSTEKTFKHRYKITYNKQIILSNDYWQISFR